MKIFCIDALDWRKVEELGLKNLMLKRHGKLKVPIHSSIKAPTSPDVWRAFLTGERVQVQFTTKSNLIKPLIWLRGKIPRSIIPSLGIGQHLNQDIDYPPRDFKTVFDDYPYVKDVNMPYYSFDCKAGGVVVLEYLAGKMTAEEYNEYLVESAEKQVEKMKNAKEPWIGYIIELDSAQHVFYKNEDIINDWYKLCDYYAKILDPDIILSDHGAEEGRHSNVGFWSSKLAINPKNIMDFKSIISKLLNDGESHDN